MRPARWPAPAWGPGPPVGDSLCWRGGGGGVDEGVVLEGVGVGGSVLFKDGLVYKVNEVKTKQRDE